MEVGLVRKIDIDQEMQQAYLDYAMSVIVARALPDARDGLKPVHRRILYAMYDMGLRSATPFKKSARIVGEVLGKYHPHGDAAVYDAMARMAQDFSMRYPLIEGQGNFGSVDGDPPAAMRYTEARLAPTAMEMIADIQKNTVEFETNFDDSLSEPAVLPAALPNLLINGATGIAVGMSTNVPPHNLNEIVDALVYMLERWDKLDDISIEDLMQFVHGPDFPTGGVILHNPEEDGLRSAYATGRGRVIVQAKAHLEEMARGRKRIIITELPYQTNKSSLIERIAKLAREEDLEGISDLRDESDRQGMRVVIELTKTADPEQVLQDLYRRTPLRMTFGIIMLALVNDEPRLLSLKQALRVYLEHRLTIVRRRSEFDLARARDRAHILEGIRTALQNLDAVIDLIRKSRTVENARAHLRKQFKLTPVQAQAILDMPLRRLAALERRKIEQEYKDVTSQIRQLQALLKSAKKMRQVIAEELLAVRESFGDGRRTQIVELQEGASKATVLTASDVTPQKSTWIAITPDGLISRSPDNKLPRLSGRQAPLRLLQAHTLDTIYLANEMGEAAALAAHVIPETPQPEEGLPVHRVSPLPAEPPVADLLNLPAKDQIPEGWYVLSVTRAGMVKKSLLDELPGPSATPFTLARVNEGDRLGWLRLTDGGSDILLITATGMAIRFSEEEVRPMGLVAAGVMGIKLRAGDEVVAAEIVPDRGEVFLARSDGQAKRVNIRQFPRQGRYGQGVIAWKLPAGVRLVGAAIGKPNQRITLRLARLAPKQVRLDAAPVRTRPAQGKDILELKAGDRLVSLTVPGILPRPEPQKKQTRRRK